MIKTSPTIHCAMSYLIPFFLIAVLCMSAEPGEAEVMSATLVRFPVLIGDHIRSITADSNSVWVATDRGVSRLLRTEGRWVSYTKMQGLVSDDVYVIASDGMEVWFGTNHGVSRYNVAANTWSTYREEDGLLANKVNHIALDANYVWIATDKGLSRFDRNINSWAARTTKDGLTSDTVTTIAVEKQDVWIGTQVQRTAHMGEWEWRETQNRSGLNRYDKASDSWNTYTPEEGLISGQVSTIAADKETVWVGTRDAGISGYSKKDQAFILSYSKADLLDTNNIMSIVVDGNYTWIGTANSGIYRYIKITDTWNHFTTRDGLASDHITSIAVSGNEVWFGTYQNGLSRYDKLTQEWTTYVKASFLADNDVRSLAIKDDEVWVATTRGLSQYDITKERWTIYDVKDGLTSEHTTLVSIQEGQIFFSTENGLGSLDRQQNRWTFYPYSGDDSLSIAALAVWQGFLYLGTAEDGILRLPLHGEVRLDPFLKVDQLPHPSITAIAFSDTVAWIGTQAGVLLFDRTQGTTSSLYKEEDGLASNHVNAILHDGDITWIGTRKGLSRYDRTEGLWETFDSQDGLPSDNVRALASDGEKLWLGTPNGLTCLAATDAGVEVRTASFKGDRRSFYDNIRAIGIRENVVWCATAAGVVELNPSTGEWREHRAEPKRTPFIESGVTEIQFDGTDVWLSNWLTSSLGCIARFDRVSQSWLRYTVRDIMDSRQERNTTSITHVREIIPETHWVWFATDLGILRYDKKLDTWRHYTTADGLVDNNTRELVRGDNTIWVSSSGRKLNRYSEQDDTWVTLRFPDQRNMEGNPIEREHEWRLEDIEMQEQQDRWSSIRNLAIADGAIWLQMGDGITLFNERTKEQQQFTTADGLASDRVRCLEYDGRYVWVGHESDDQSGIRGGVSRYDTTNSEWDSYSSQTVLADDRVERILVSEDYVWLLPERWSRSGVTGFDNTRSNWFVLKPKADSGGDEGDQFQGGITEVVSDSESIWVGTMQSGLLQFHTASDSWRFLSDREQLLGNVVLKDGLQVDESWVWVGTMGGLRLYDKVLETWTTYAKPTSLVGDEVRAMALDERYLWCGTNQGISRYDKAEGLWETYQTKGGQIEIRIGNDTLHWYQERSRKGLMANRITGLAVDEQYLWVTTSEGANRYDKIADIWDRYSEHNGLPSNSLTAVAADGSDVWAGTNRGLCKYPRMSDDPNAWATYTSMIEIQPMVFSQEYASSLVSNKVRALAAEESTVWVGTERGVSRYDKRQDTWRTFTSEDGLVDGKVSCIALDADDVWFGTAHGVSKFSKRTLDWVTLTKDDGLPSNQITCIATDGEWVWFGTFDAGLARYSKQTQEWTQFTEEDGLAHNSVLSMALEDGTIWVGTRRGLSRYQPRTEGWTIYRER